MNTTTEHRKSGNLWHIIIPVVAMLIGWGSVRGILGLKQKREQQEYASTGKVVPQPLLDEIIDHYNEIPQAVLQWALRETKKNELRNPVKKTDLLTEDMPPTQQYTPEEQTAGQATAHEPSTQEEKKEEMAALASKTILTNRTDKTTIASSKSEHRQPPPKEHTISPQKMRSNARSLLKKNVDTLRILNEG